MKNLYSALVSLCFIAIFVVFTNVLGNAVDTLYTAKIIDVNKIELVVNPTQTQKVDFQFKIKPKLAVFSVEKQDEKITLTTENIDLTKTFFIDYCGNHVEIMPDGVLDHFYSDKKMGCSISDRETIFRLFAPRAKRVTLVIFEDAYTEVCKTYEMIKDDDGVWEFFLEGHFFGNYYGFKIEGPSSEYTLTDYEHIIADPYSQAVASENNYWHKSRSMIVDHDKFDWEGDRPLGYKMQDLMIYECHVRDLTKHPSSGADASFAGTYKALCVDNIRGGMAHIKSLGVNAVEFLPVQDFGNYEIPFNEPAQGTVNTWNPYARNHWGYMTSYFFAPESYYASEQTLEPGKKCGVGGNQVDEFKELVKTCHKNGIAVIMDVVYNHVSQYDLNCFKYIDKQYYFHINDDQTFCAASGCGNDFKTDRKMARKLIIDSVLFWMQEYHVDGFRFDLASMIDWETTDEILKQARAINPDVVLIAEAWGGGKYTPAEHSQHNWAAWNDQIRNGVKGQNPESGHGFILGEYFDFNNLSTMKRYVLGNLVADGGMFVEKTHSINYLESHDDHTLGDFIRLSLGADDEVVDVDANARLTPLQLQLNKLAAAFLFTSQGALMIHEGQEWARSKVIAETDLPDSQIGMIDHNSYNKDNETNWLNFDHADMNKELVDYYEGLIALRRAHPAFRYSTAADIRFMNDPKNHLAFAYIIDKDGSGDSNDFLVALNGNRFEEASFTLPEGEWSVIVNSQTAGTQMLGKMSGQFELAPSSALVLKQ